MSIGYRAFPDAQIAALIALCGGILAAPSPYRPRACWVTAMWRRRARTIRANCFPGQRLAEAGIGVWPQGAPSDLGPEALARYGYDPKAPQDKVITAFQRHFRPEKLDGKWDGECAGLLACLLSTAGV